MTTARDERIGSISIVLASTLLAVYATLFALLLHAGGGAFDYTAAVASPHWRAIALVGFAGVIALLLGLDAIHSRMRATAGATAIAGLLLTKVALILQACVITWELLLDPIVAGHPESVFLIRDRVIINDPAMAAFRVALLAFTASARCRSPSPCTGRSGFPGPACSCSSPVPRSTPSGQ